MGFLDNLKGFISTEGEPYGTDVDYPDGTEGEAPETDGRDVYSTNYTSDETTSSKNKYVNIHGDSKLSVVLVKPESFAEASSIADHLNSKRTVVLNLESTSKDVSRRLVDFLSGVAYANSGTLKRVANCTYIITPFNVDVMGDGMIDDISDNGGMYI